jgi:thymidylate synthase (FAD)
MLLRHGHGSVIEHGVASVRFITNRGVTHELVRHRIASFSQESTRYVRYDGQMEFIQPVWWASWSETEKKAWENAMQAAEKTYQLLLRSGSRPEQAREVLPNSLKTEIVMTANLREWIHVFNLRCSKASHPQIRALMLACKQGFREAIPVFFDD